MMKLFLSFHALIFIAAVAIAAPSFAAEPLSGAQERGALFQLTNDDAQSAIAQALVEKGAGKKLSATILGREGDVLFSYNRPVTAEIHGLRYDAATHRWNASLLFKSGQDVVSAIPASGRYDEVVDVPVLTHEVRNGQIISEGDVEMHSITQTQTRSDTVLSISDIVGKSPVRSISAQRPIRTAEISNPAVVKKNSMVQLRFESDGINISTTGQAMEDGAAGDIINVRNVASKRIVKALIENASSVRVVTPGNLPNASMTNLAPQSANTAKTAQINSMTAPTGGAYAAN